MTSSSSVPAPAGARSALPFRSIVCGVDGSRVAAEAARQAAALATTGAQLTLAGVGWSAGHGLSAQATIAPGHIADALDRARIEARELGVTATVLTLESREETATLLAEAAHHDLLVLGASTSSRATGILAGSTASAAVHGAPGPVLLARRPPAEVPFPSSILVAFDGSSASAAAAEAAAGLARAHGARVSIVAPSDLDATARERLAAAIETITGATGVAPVVLDERTVAHRAIVDAAQTMQAALLVVGSRGLHGVHALASVSERVAHEAPCSVLVMRPRVVPAGG